MASIIMFRLSNPAESNPTSSRPIVRLSRMRSTVGSFPIYEKENAFDWFSKGYDQIAIIDADIYIRPDKHLTSSSSLEPQYDFGAVVERDMPISGAVRTEDQQLLTHAVHSSQGCELGVEDWGAKFYNMGMMVMNRIYPRVSHGETARQFITRPEFKRFVDGDGAWKWSTDQTLLNWWVKKAGGQGPRHGLEVERTLQGCQG